MKLMITGALGHVGSRLIHGLKPGEFEEVILLDNLSMQRYASLFNLPTGVLFRFIEDDVCTADLERLLVGVDIVIHLAAITDAAGSFEMQAEVERINFEGTERVGDACGVCGCRLIFISTTSVYGTQRAVVDEDCLLEELKPQSPYAESKLRAEECLQGLGQSVGLRFVICRFGTIFGTSMGMRFHTAINKFVWQACTGLPITVWREALNQMRPYLDLDDAVRALRFIIEQNVFDGCIYNVLTTNATVDEIIAIIRRFIPDLSVQLVDSRIMNQLSYEVSNHCFRSLGFEFRGSLEQGIQDTIRLLQNAGQRRKVVKET
jgi:nucleoside-diphosphate-sugar epimerase